MAYDRTDDRDRRRSLWTGVFRRLFGGERGSDAVADGGRDADERR
jgi:hypothetical protein